MRTESPKMRQWLYSEENLQEMKIICFLWELDLPINAIAQLIAEAFEIGTVLLWVLDGIWWPFVFIAPPAAVRAFA